MSRPLFNVTSAPFNGPFGLNAILMAGVIAAPYEGLWVPVNALSSMSVEVQAPNASGLGVQLFGTNDPTQINVNEYTITIGGTITSTDVVELTFTGSNLSSSVVISHTVAGGDSTAIIAAALAASINANPSLNGMGLGIVATAAGSVITLLWPSANQNTYSPSPSQPAMSNDLTIVGAVTGGATETVTVATGTEGTAIGASITGAGFSVIIQSMALIKARLTSLTGAGASVTALLQGSP